MIKQLLLGLFCCLPLWLHAEPAPEQGGSVKADYQGNQVDFPLLSSHYSVDIQGDLATVHLQQQFANPTQTPLNAQYLFPLNQDAAVYAMQMQVGDETVTAQIHRTEEAKTQFEQAKQEGKAAAMLEQHRPNMFTQNLANLMPGKPITVNLSYTQHVPRLDGQYELVLPLVVGPRYQPAQTTTATTNNTQPDSTAAFGKWELQALPAYPPVTGLDVPTTVEAERVGITVRLQAGMPINAISSQTHAIEIGKVDERNQQITLSKGKVIDNRDFVLHYHLSGSEVQAGLLTHQDERGHFFSLLLEPPAIPAPTHITPREMVFVLDTSGSMSGQPLDASKAFMLHALKHLRPEDTFRVIDFSSSPREFSSQPLPATASNLNDGLQHVSGLEASGGTEIEPAIQQAFAPAVPTGSLRIVVFLTDGYIGNEADVLARIHQSRGDARIYALGVGTSVNRYLLDEMARAGRGFSRYLDPTKDTQDQAIQFANRLETPVMTDIQIDWGGMQVEGITPAVLPDLFTGDSLRMLGKILNPEHAHTLKVSGKVNGQQASMALQLPVQQADNSHSKAIPLIWARSQIADWMREFNLPAGLVRHSDMQDDQLKQRITRLGLDYSLMTQWTSFLAVSSKVVNDNPVTSKDAAVPLPMVNGVTALAYPETASMGNNFVGSSTPEPAVIWGLLGLVLLVGWFRFLRFC